ncbi:MAG: hypothetical protein ABH851_02325 [Methanobacteriota archaeon]
MNKKRVLFVTAAYALLTVFITYPAVLELNEKFIGSGEIGLFTWTLWWVKKAVLTKGVSLFYTQHLFHPQGVSLAIRALTFYNTFIGILLQQVYSLPATYNILVLSSFILSGLGMYLLAKHVSGSELGSFLAGVVYAFNPYRLIEVNVGHLNLIATQWIPFYLLYLIRSHKEGGKTNILFAGIFLALTNLSSWQYMGMVLIFTVVYIAYHKFFNSAKVQFSLNGVYIATILGLLITLPFIYPLASEYARSDYMNYPIGFLMGTSATYSADGASILASPIIGYKTRNIIPVGYTVILLALFFVYSEKKILPWITGKAELVKIYLRNQFKLIAIAGIIYFIFLYVGLKQYYGGNLFCYSQTIILIALTITVLFLVRDKVLSFWIFTAILFYSLSLGPVVKLFESTCEFPTPYLLLFFAPGGTIFRTPYRFYAVFTVALSILFALGFANLYEKTGQRKLLSSVVVALVFFEFLLQPISLTDASLPKVYDIIKDNPGDFAILEVPIPPVIYHIENGTLTYSMPQIQYYQTYHGKKIIGGYVERHPPSVLEFIDENSPFCELRNAFSGSRKQDCVGEPSIESLRGYDIQYIIVHKDFIRTFPYSDESTLPKVEVIVKEIVGEMNPIYEDENIAAYRIQVTG